MVAASGRAPSRAVEEAGCYSTYRRLLCTGRIIQRLFDVWCLLCSSSQEPQTIRPSTMDRHLSAPPGQYYRQTRLAAEPRVSSGYPKTRGCLFFWVRASPPTPNQLLWLLLDDTTGSSLRIRQITQWSTGCVLVYLGYGDASNNNTHQFAARGAWSNNPRDH